MVLGVVTVSMLTATVVAYLAVRDAPDEKSYDTQARCEKKTNKICQLEICNNTVSTPTMATTCAKDARRGWVADIT